MDDGRLPKQVLPWKANTTKRRTGRPGKNWTDTVKENLIEIGMSREQAQERCADNEDWGRCDDDNGNSNNLRLLELQTNRYNYTAITYNKLSRRTEMIYSSDMIRV